MAAISTTKSAISNGTRLHPVGTVDGRSAEARRFKDLMRAYASNLGVEAKLDEAQIALVRQAAALTLEGERLQASIVSGRQVKAGDLTRISNSVTRTLRAAWRRAPSGRAMTERNPHA